MPSDCLIKIVKGPEEGQQFRCTGAETVLGRSPRSHVRLGSPTVSFEHAVITRAGDTFFVENLSAAGTFVNDERIAGRVRLRTRDRLRLGQETVVRVEELPASASESGRRRLLVIAVVAMVVMLVLVIVADPLSPSTANINWRKAYARIDAWTQQQVDAGVLPVETRDHLEKGWRLREAGDSAGAAREWLRLRILLAGLEQRVGLEALSAEHPRALVHLVHPPKPTAAAPSTEPSEEEMGAALIQFVRQMQRRR